MKIIIHYIYLVLCFVIIVCSASSCHDDYLNVDNMSFNFSALGESKSLKISSNCDWSISGDQSWLDVYPSSGSKDQIVTLRASKNTTRQPNDCSLYISSDAGLVTITIHQDPATPLFTVDNNNLYFSSKSDDSKSVNIKSNGSWSITGVPSWLRASTTSGNGDSQVSFTTISANKSSLDHIDNVKIKCEDMELTITVTQEHGLAKNCNVKPNHITVLSNGIAFDMSCEKEAVRYYRGYIKTSETGLMSDDEIIEVLEQSFSRHLVSEDEVPDFTELDPGTKYTIYTLGYNSAGERGDLIATEVTTKVLVNNEPLGWVGDMTNDNSYWYWSITKSATCYSYYMMTSEDFDIAFASDVLQAWWIDEAIRLNQITEYVNGGNWNQKKYGWMFAVWTRGKDARGNLSNKLDWDFAMDAASSRVRKVPNKLQKNVKGDHSGKKLKPGTYKFYFVE